MPGLDDIRDTWDSPSGWTAGGEEWSGAWGGSERQWQAALLPRVRSFLPAGTILEIGPGQGRWSRYLKDHCDRLVLVDVAAHALEACRRRLGEADHVEYHVGDGLSLPAVGDGAVDLAFSFDSLVHAESDVLEAYAQELGRVLSREGVGLIHVSNMGAHRRLASATLRVPEPLRRRLVRAGVLPNTFAWRAQSTTGAGFADSCERAGLSCIAIELLAWEHGRYLTDAIVVVTRPGSRWERPRQVDRNRGFISGEASAARRIARLYG